MKQIGLTGGIGSGKTTVAKVFKSLGVPVFNADEVAKECTNEATVKSQIIYLLGEKAYTNDAYNTAYVATKVFKDKDLLQQLNNIIHPAVAKAYALWFEENKESPYIIKEAAIMFESGTYKKLDKTILVLSPKELRIERIMKRNSLSREEVIQRMENQWDDEKKKTIADFILYNNENQLLIPQILNLHQDILHENIK